MIVTAGVEGMQDIHTRRDDTPEIRFAKKCQNSRNNYW